MVQPFSFISSCLVHVRKPDADIFRLALNMAQASTREGFSIENTAMFVEVAQSLGIHRIHHPGLKTTQSALETLREMMNATNQSLIPFMIKNVGGGHRSGKQETSDA